MAKKQANTVPQFTIVLDQHATKDGVTTWTEVEFSHPSERGVDVRMNDAESVAFNDLFVHSLFSITNPESVKLHRCDYNAPLFHWWDEFIRGPLRNVRIGSDEFRRSRASLIDASLLRHTREAAQLSIADFQSLSLVEVFDLIDGIKIREHNAANAKAIDQTGRKPDEDRTQKKNSTKNLRPWDTTCQRMAKAYIRQCVKDGREIARLPFITEELRVNRTNYPNAKSAATINKAFQVNPDQWKPVLSEALS